MNEKSEVEIYWDQIASVAGDNRKLQDLSGQEQMMLVQSINLLLLVLDNGRKQS